MSIDQRTPLVSIIIINFNGGRYIIQCLNSVLNTAYPNFEVILVDNNSNDGSLKMICNLFGKEHRLRIYPLKVNIGFAAANNFGAHKAKGEYIVFLNPDTRVEKNWLIELMKAAEIYRGFGALQPLLKKMDSELLDGAGDFPTVHGISLIFAHCVRNSTNIYPKEIFSARAAAMLIRKNVFKEVGGFDPDYFIGYEDVDLGWRIRLRGMKIFLVPSSVVEHIGRASTKMVSDLESFHKHKNCMITLIKNFNLKNLIIHLPVTFTLRFLLSISPFQIIRDVTKTGFSAVKALLYIISNFRKIWKKRLAVQIFIRKVQDDEILGKMLPARFWVDLLRWFLIYKRKTNFWDYLFFTMVRYIHVNKYAGEKVV
jgi:GT2 family glycosyltransferase